MAHKLRTDVEIGVGDGLLCRGVEALKRLNPINAALTKQKHSFFKFNPHIHSSPSLLISSAYTLIMVFTMTVMMVANSAAASSIEIGSGVISFLRSFLAK